MSTAARSTAPASEGGKLAALNRPLVRAALALIPAAFAAQTFISSAWLISRTTLLAIAAITLASPTYGVHAVALLTPFGPWLDSSVQPGSVGASSAMVMAFLGVWLLRATSDRDGPRLPPWVCGVAIMLLLLDRSAVNVASTIGGLVLATAVLWVFRQQPSLAVTLPAAMCAGVAAAVLPNVLARRALATSVLIAAASAAFGTAARRRDQLRIRALAFGAVLAGTLTWTAPRPSSMRIDLTFVFWMSVAMLAGLAESGRMNARARGRHVQHC